MKKTSKLTVYDQIRSYENPNDTFVAVAHESEDTKVLILLPRAILAEPKPVHAALLNRGATVPSDYQSYKSALTKALNNPTPRPLTFTNRCGWIDGNHITTGRTYSQEAGTVHHVDRLLRAKQKTFSRSSFVPLKRVIRKLNAHSSLALFAFSAGVAGPVMDLVGLQEGAAFYLFGQTTTGKTTLALMARSLSASVTPNALPTFDLSVRGIDELAFEYNDATLILDELSRLPGGDDERTVSNFAHRLSSGRGRQVSKSKIIQTPFPNLSWRCMGLMTGEIDIDAFESRRKPQGQNARLIQIPVNARSEGGMFDRRQKRQAAVDYAELLREFRDAAQRHDGYAFSKFVRYIVANRVSAEAMAQDVVARFLSQCGVRDDTFERRRAEKFALVAAAGEIAIAAKLFPVRAGRALRAAIAIYRQADTSPYRSSTPPLGTLIALQHAISAPDKFPEVAGGHVVDAASWAASDGFITIEGRRRFAYVKKDHIAAILGQDTYHRVRKQLVRIGIAITSNNRRSTFVQSEKATGRRLNYLKIDIALLDAAVRGISNSGN